MTSPEPPTLDDSEAIFSHTDSFCQHLENLRDQLIRLSPELDCIEEEIEILLLSDSFSRLGIRPPKFRRGRTDTTFSDLQKEFKKFMSQFSGIIDDFNLCLRMVCDGRFFFDLPHDAQSSAPNNYIYVEYRDLFQDYTEVLKMSTTCCELIVEGRRRFVGTSQEGSDLASGGV